MGEGTLGLMEMLLLQNYAPLFWAFVFMAGLLPLLLVANPKTRKPKWIVVAAALVVAGMWLKRFLIVVTPLRQGLFPGTTSTYSGSLVEVAITLGASAAIPLLIMLLLRVFPVMSISEMEEVAIKSTDIQPKLAINPAPEGEQL